MSNDAIYSIARDGKTIGQFALPQIKERLKAGQLKTSDFYWVEGMAEWKPISELTPPPLPKSRKTAKWLLIGAAAFVCIGAAGALAFYVKETIAAAEAREAEISAKVRALIELPPEVEAGPYTCDLTDKQAITIARALVRRDLHVPATARFNEFDKVERYADGNETQYFVAGVVSSQLSNDAPFFERAWAINLTIKAPEDKLRLYTLNEMRKWGIFSNCGPDINGETPSRTPDTFTLWNMCELNKKLKSRK